MNGILNIIKPPGMTSQNVVSYVKRIIKVSKAGHTGTLDPGAAGVLPVCIGKATRISEYLLNDKKSYRGELKLGLTSDTLDKYGNIQEVMVPDINDCDIYRAFEHFKGDIEQIPPMFSAVKHNGKRLYELAREGIEIEREKRHTHIYDISILDIEGHSVLFDVTCSKGTYIRSLCSDIGKYLGCDAIMTFLIRTKTGPFGIEDSVTLDEVKTAVENKYLDKILYGTDAALAGYSSVHVDDITSKKVLNGVGFYIGNNVRYKIGYRDDILLIYDSSNNFIAIGKKTDERDFIKIGKVFV